MSVLVSVVVFSYPRLRPFSCALGGGVCVSSGVLLGVSYVVSFLGVYAFAFRCLVSWCLGRLGFSSRGVLLVVFFSWWLVLRRRVLLAMSSRRDVVRIVVCLIGIVIVVIIG